MNETRLNKKYLPYTKDEVEGLLKTVEGRKFFVPMTQDEYEALSEEAKMNGNLYLIIKKKG